MTESLIFEHSRPGRAAAAQFPTDTFDVDLPEALARRRSGISPSIRISTRWVRAR